MRSSISCTPATDTPARLRLPPFPSQILSTYTRHIPGNQPSKKQSKRERERDKAKTKQKISMNRSRNIFSINMCGRNGFEEVKRARHKPRILNYGTHKGSRGGERKKKRHKRTLNLHKINSIIVYCLFYRFVYKKC